MDFMFDENLLENETDENLLKSSEFNITKEENRTKEKDLEKKKEKNIEITEKEYPIFFKQIRINETVLTLSIFFYEKSKFVIILLWNY